MFIVFVFKCKRFLKPICFQNCVSHFVTSFRTVRIKTFVDNGLYEKRCKSSEIFQTLCPFHFILLFSCDDFIERVCKTVVFE